MVKTAKTTKLSTDVLSSNTLPVPAHEDDDELETNSVTEETPTVLDAEPSPLDTSTLKLTQTLVQQLKLTSPVEQNLPSLKGVKQEEYLEFRTNFREYLRKGGCQSVVACMGPTAKMGYSFFLKITDWDTAYPFEKNDDLLAALDLHHELDSDLPALLSAQKMPSNAKMESDPIAAYVAEWIQAYSEYATLRNADKTNQVAIAVVKYLQPAAFRNVVKATKPQSFQEAVDVIMAEIKNLRIVAKYNVDKSINEQTNNRNKTRNGQSNKHGDGKTKGQQASKQNPCV
jgi:hypothetical protein